MGGWLWVTGLPALAMAAVVLVVVHPGSLARLVAITSIGLAFGSLIGASTAAGVWYVVRGRVLPTVLGSALLERVLPPPIEGLHRAVATPVP